MPRTPKFVAQLLCQLTRHGHPIVLDNRPAMASIAARSPQPVPAFTLSILLIAVPLASDTARVEMVLVAANDNAEG